MRLCVTLSVCVITTGCLSVPPAANPLPAGENPAVVMPSRPDPAAYAKVFETTLDVLDDYFDIATSDRYSGQIETEPLVAPGLVQFWRRGSPDPRERLLASLQTIRYRCKTLITAGPAGGYLVQVEVYKELEDLQPRPLRAIAGSATFLSNATVERQFDIIDPQVVDTQWVPLGREAALEQRILRRIQGALE